MFFNCKNLNELNLSSFNISKCKNNTDKIFGNINDKLKIYLYQNFIWTRDFLDITETSTINIICTTRNIIEPSS